VVLTALSENLIDYFLSPNRPKRLGTSLSEALSARVLLQLEVILETDCTDLVFDLVSHSVPEVTKEAILFLSHLLLDSGDVSFDEEFDEEDEGVDDVLTMSFEGT